MKRELEDQLSNEEIARRMGQPTKRTGLHHNGGPPQGQNRKNHSKRKSLRSRPHIGALHLDLTDDEAAALIRELHDIMESDHYPFSPRIRTLRGILNKLRPELAREL